VIWQGGKPKAVILSIEDYLRLAPPEPEVLRLIREESVKHGTDNYPWRKSTRSSPRFAGSAASEAVPLRLVLDTNVIVSATLTPRGFPQRTLDYALSTHATLFVTDQILAEYEATFRKPKLRVVAIVVTPS
jgi:hypothetical protein